MIEYRKIKKSEINRELFSHFIRHQAVMDCWRRDNGEWIIRNDPFIDDWNEEDYKVLLSCLKRTVAAGGFLFAAFCDCSLKGFVSVEPKLFGGKHKYIDLSNIYVSEDMRHKGIGSVLFLEAKKWAKNRGAKKLYISAHSSVESQAFYHKMGCIEACLYSKTHVDTEPYDCQLECEI